MELLLNLLFKIDQLLLDLWIDVPLAIARLQLELVRQGGVGGYVPIRKTALLVSH